MLLFIGMVNTLACTLENTVLGGLAQGRLLQLKLAKLSISQSRKFDRIKHKDSKSELRKCVYFQQ